MDGFLVKEHRRAMVLPNCENRIGMGPPQARTEVIYVDLGCTTDCIVPALRPVTPPPLCCTGIGAFPPESSGNWSPVCDRTRKVDVRLPEKGSLWREAGPPNRFDDKVDSDQEVASNKIYLCNRTPACLAGVR